MVLAYQGQFCAWFSLTQLPTESAQVVFSESFSKRKGFIFLPSASHPCSMLQQDFFCTLFFAQSQKNTD